MINDIIKRRLKGTGIGFDNKNSLKEKKDLSLKSHPEDLLKYGFIPELIGRLPIIASLEKLDKKALSRILIEPENALTKQYKKLFKIEDVHLEFTECAINEIVSQAMKRNTGARGLRAILESSMMEIMYEIPSMEKVDTCIITAEVIKKEKKPTIKYIKRSA